MSIKIKTKKRLFDEPYEERETPLGSQRIYKFPNGYGASIVKLPLLGILGFCGSAKFGWELAVLKFKKGGKDFDLCYDTPITDDVIQGLTDEKVEKILRKIEKLPTPKKKLEKS